MEKTSSNSQTQMPSSPSSAGTLESEKSQQPRPSAIMPSILTRIGSERARPRATSRLHPFLGDVPADAVLLYDPELLGAHDVSPLDGLRPLMKALASGTSVASAVVTAVVAAVLAVVSPQHPASVAAPVS